MSKTFGHSQTILKVERSGNKTTHRCNNVKVCLLHDTLQWNLLIQIWGGLGEGEERRRRRGEEEEERGRCMKGRRRRGGGV